MVAMTRLSSACNAKKKYEKYTFMLVHLAIASNVYHANTKNAQPFLQRRREISEAPVQRREMRPPVKEASRNFLVLETNFGKYCWFTSRGPPDHEALDVIRPL